MDSSVGHCVSTMPVYLHNSLWTQPFLISHTTVPTHPDHVGQASPILTQDPMGCRLVLGSFWAWIGWLPIGHLPDFNSEKDGLKLQAQKSKFLFYNGIWEAPRAKGNSSIAWLKPDLTQLTNLPGCICQNKFVTRSWYGQRLIHILGRFTLGTITNFNLNFMTLVIKFSLKTWHHPNHPKHPDIEVWMFYVILSIKSIHIGAVIC
jgi:hypothetical protein